RFVQPRSSRAPAIVAATSVILLAGCATNPATGKRQISFVSESKEIAMGQEADPAVLAEYGLYGDSTVQKYVDSVGQKLVRVSQRPDLSWHFRVLDSPVVNAFAIPGGYIYITRGILAYLNSEAQLAGVLGHEIGHVTARHTAQQITRAQIAGIGLLAGALFVDAFRPYSGLAQQGLSLLFLKYSRDNETQADELGVGYAVQAGYDPREIPGTYAMLKRVEERSGGGLPGFLETHPDPGDREIRTMQLAQAAAASARRDLLINSSGYRKTTEGLVFGDDPRGGFFDGNRFYHPDLAFQMIFPDGWEKQNQPSAVVARNQAAGAAMELTLQTAKDSTLTPALYVESLRREGKILDASGRSEEFRDYPAWIGTILVGGQGGRAAYIAGFVGYRPGQFLQVLGQARSDADPAAEQIRTAIRSLASLRDSTKLGASPDRVHTLPAPASGTFESIVPTLGPQGLDLEQTAILNNLRATTPVSAGSPIKIIRKGHRE
ncbi:MAG TPA: M48 family metalloprotease, partial [Candidatus Eisenbacteria bacterium]